MKHKKFATLYGFNNREEADFSLGVNPLGCSPLVLKAIRQISIRNIAEYPDSQVHELKAGITKQHGINPKQIFLSNGSDAIINLIPRVLIGKNDEVIIPELTFPLFRFATQIAGGKVVLSPMTKAMDINLSDIRNKITKKTRLIFICNPNNPTGKVIAKRKLLDFVQSIKIPIVVDEASIEFGGNTVIKEVPQFKNLIVLRTFSKGFGMAGLRIGFCVANDNVIKQLKKLSLPFSVSSVAQLAALSALKDNLFILNSRKIVKNERIFMTRELKRRGLRIIKSETNFLFVGKKELSFSMKLFLHKLREKGISVVEGSSFSNKTSDFFRFSLKTRNQNKLFLKTIDEIL